MSKIPHDHCHPDCAAFANENNRGLTKREYFAAMALQGLCANSSVDLDPSCGECAVELADNLITALNKPVQP